MRRIGIRPALNGTWGGIYQYSLNTIDAAEGLSRDDFVLLSDNPADPALEALRERGWKILASSPPRERRPVLDLVGRALGEGPHRQALRRLRASVRRATSAESQRTIATIRHRPDWAEWWRRHEIGLVFYPAPTAISFEVDIPYVITVHDIEHRLDPEFAEVTGHGEWERREYLYRNCGRHATMVLFNSDVEREQFLFFYGPYGVTADRLKVLPLVPAPYLVQPSADHQRQIAVKYGVPERYLIYPGQLWPHKNHARIIQALERLKLTRGLEIPVVFCGSHSGEVRERHFRLVMRMAEDCGVATQIRYLGYVPDEDMSALYAGATALVMPTLFGPTATPPREAWAYGCPVLVSDIPGTKEQLGEAAILVDPRSVEAIAGGISQLWTNEELRKRLSRAGHERLGHYTLDDFRRRLGDLLDEAKERAGFHATKRQDV